jgi:hypothetical protein
MSDNERRPSSNVNVDEEVKRLFRKNAGKFTSADIKALRQKYDDVEVAERIEKAYYEKFTNIEKKAKKFAQLIREKYSSQQQPFHVLLEKARAFKTKYELDEDEFAAFQRIYEQELVGISSPEVYSANTNMMKVLGSVSIDYNGFNSKMSDADYKTLQELLKLHASSRPLHAQVVLQSMQYEDCAYEALSGEYKREMGHKAHEHVHPVVAALFLPKIDVLESHFLQSNIAGIVKSRYNNEPMSSRADYELFYALTNDPNDVVCDNRSPVLDLLNRANVQNQLWNCVLNLRNGQYYNASFRDFIGAVDMCKLNRQDTPDFVYGRYDGTVLRRILSTFSFRPTVVSTMPIYNIVNVNPYQQNVRPKVTAVPMVNLKVPAVVDNVAIGLNEALSQQQFVIENGVMVPRDTNIIYSRGVLFFFVDRRSDIFRTTPNMQPFDLARMPTAISGFERIHDRPIIVEPSIGIREDTYELRSVVVAETSRVKPGIVIGSSTLIMSQANVSKGIFDNGCVIYNPLGVLDTSVDQATGIQTRSNPIYDIEYSGSNGESFKELAEHKGIIFMYELVKDSTSGEFNY